MTDDNKNKEVKTEPAAEAEREEKAENAETPAAETAEEQNGKDAKKKQRRAEAALLTLKKKVEEQTAALAADVSTLVQVNWTWANDDESLGRAATNIIRLPIGQQLYQEAMTE